jgi:selenide, water dikinase
VAVTLTSLSHGAGCGCKLPAAAIAPLLQRLAPVADPNVLVGFGTSDDAGVYKVRDDLAIVQTVDFFTPIVDDPFDFGRIAAANALSDIYAMGATPLSALNLVAFSLSELGEDVLASILAGGAEVAAAAGVAIIGGHSIEDAEPKFGMAVMGTVHPDELITNAGGRPNDALVLTKPLGAGAVSTAVKRGLPAPLPEAVAVMSTLNRDAAGAARRAGAHAMTDVTGFGLLGHALEMARGASKTLTIDVAALPWLRETVALAQQGFITGASGRNWRSYGAEVSLPADTPEWQRQLYCDPQTSGGLLVACAADHADALLETIVTSGYPAACIIGEVTDGAPRVVLET